MDRLPCGLTIRGCGEKELVLEIYRLDVLTLTECNVQESMKHAT